MTLTSVTVLLKATARARASKELPLITELVDIERFKRVGPAAWRPIMRADGLTMVEVKPFESVAVIDKS